MQTPLMEAQRSTRLQAAMHRLLDGLRPYMRAFGRTPESELPEHDLVWVTDIGRGPERTILDAIKANPDLWAPALPSECCIVPRKVLVRLLGANVAEALAMDGEYLVDNQAARLRDEAEQRERLDR